MNRIYDKKTPSRKRKRKQKKKKILFPILIILTAAVFTFGLRFLSSLSGYSAHESGSSSKVDLDNLNSSHAILTDLDSGEVIGTHNEQEKIYPASLTKIMTAVLAIEYTENLDEWMTLPVDIFQGLYEENASMAGFQPGEDVCLKDLIYGILLPSGAECCLAFADRIAGSEEAFVTMMNEKAKEIGMHYTQFRNTTGLHDPEHYSTVKDISILLQYALKNEDFKTAFTTSQYTSLPSNLHPDGITFYSTMFQNMDTETVTQGTITGGKTGYTPEAGLCLASTASINGRNYMLVTAKAKGNHDTAQFHILDAVHVYDRISKLVDTGN